MTMQRGALAALHDCISCRTNAAYRTCGFFVCEHTALGDFGALARVICLSVILLHACKFDVMSWLCAQRNLSAIPPHATKTA